MPDPSQIPMPPDRYTADDRVGTVHPDRCPAGHRADDPDVRWIHHAPTPGHRASYSCYACKRPDGLRLGVEFRPTADLYDDLSWWFDDLQVSKRAYWKARHLSR